VRAVVGRVLEVATGGLHPDLTLLLDINAEAGLRRRQTGGGEWNRLDAYQLEFHRRVQAGYHELAAQEPARWVTLDAAQTPEMVQLALRRAIDARLK
jgi:dTMP kinase